MILGLPGLRPNEMGSVVEADLPDGDPGEAAFERFWFQHPEGLDRPPSKAAFWHSERLMVKVVFDWQDRVVLCEALPVRRIHGDASPLRMLRRWLGL